MRTTLQLANTVDPPVFRRIGDTNDPAAVGFTAGTFTSAPFDNGDNLSQILFGPPRYGKDGWAAFLSGIATVPTQATAFSGIHIVTLPAAYLPLGGFAEVAPSTHGIWGGANAFCFTMVGPDGVITIDNTGPGMIANAQYVIFHMVWPTATYGE